MALQSSLKVKIDGMVLGLIDFYPIVRAIWMASVLTLGVPFSFNFDILLVGKIYRSFIHEYVFHYR